MNTPTSNPRREHLGRIVRDVWVTWAMEQPDPKLSWLAPWEQLDDRQREVDMRIGETIHALTGKELHELRELRLTVARVLGTTHRRDGLDHQLILEEMLAFRQARADAEFQHARLRFMYAALQATVDSLVGRAFIPAPDWESTITQLIEDPTGVDPHAVIDAIRGWCGDIDRFWADNATADDVDRLSKRLAERDHRIKAAATELLRSSQDPSDRCRAAYRVLTDGHHTDGRGELASPDGDGEDRDK
jgi:hypothetical protein